MRARFQTSFGSFRPLGAEETAEVSAETTDSKKGFQLTPEAQEGLVSILAVGTKLTQKAIETAAAKKKAKAKAKSKKKKTKAAPAPTAASIAAAPSEGSGISTQTVLLGVGAFLLVGGGVWYVSSRKKAGAEAGSA
jgi:hypothetical protein